MKRISGARFLGATLAGALALSLACCTVQTAPTVAANPYPPVPPPRVEVVPKPPVSAEPLVWTPGHWDWTGAGYTWTEGRWGPAVTPGHAWRPGYWAATSSGWVWQPGGWF
jgi:hypothetical protein